MTAKTVERLLMLAIVVMLLLWLCTIARGEEYRSALKLIRERCVKCHSGDNPPNGLRLDSVDNMVRGGKHGPAIVIFKPDESLIYQAIAGTGDKVPMMPPFYRFTEEETATIRKWIYAGARQFDMSGREP
jgi:hypothetical protein